MIIDSYLLIVIFGIGEICLERTSRGKDKKSPNSHHTGVSWGLSGQQELIG
jgi:hypothetical protein